MKKEENVMDIFSLTIDEPKVEVRSVEELQKYWDEAFLIADRGVLWVFLATIIGNQLDMDPIWLHLIAPPSSGKTEFIDSVRFVKKNGKDLVFPISDLTVNTFASGQKGKDTSLLNEVRRGSMVVFKDFTSMISKEPVAQKAIMGQLREIYDKTYVKRTGNGKKVIWEGKIGIITGCTQVIYNQSEEFAAMGDRFMMYQIKQPNEKDALRKVYQNMQDNTFDKKRKKIQEYMDSYLNYCFDNIENVDIHLPEKTVNDIINIVSFTTKVSSGIITNDKKDNRVEFVPEKTMPMRMFKQILGMAKAFLFMNKIEAKAKGIETEVDLTEEQIKILYKVCFDSIPIRRRWALQIITKYELGTTTAGLATKLGYQTAVVAGWMAQLNGLGIVRREKDNNKDKWFLKPEYQEIMVQFEGITPVAESADEEEGDNWSDKVAAMNYQPVDYYAKQQSWLQNEDDEFKL